ncbi:MAG: ABC transporter permease [Blastocatellia bacterium]
MAGSTNTTRFRFWLWLIVVIGVLVPRRLRADWRQEWEAELRYRELLLAEWDNLNWKTKFDLLRRSLGAFWDALLLQPRRLEDEMIQDLRFGVRMLLKHKGFTLIAILTLSLGIGANTAIFSVVNAALLRPYPYIDTDRWAYLYEKPSAEGLKLLAVSAPNFLDWKQQSQSFSDMLLWQGWSFSISGAGEPEQMNGAFITPEVFTALGVTPVAGRFVAPTDEVQNPDRRVVIGYGLWQRRFGGDPNIAGKQVTLNLIPFTIAGVAPPGFSFPPNSRNEIWIPRFTQTMRSDIERNPAGWRSARGFAVAAKLKPGVSLQTAQAEMNLIAERLASQYPEDKGYGVRVMPMRDDIAGDFRMPLLAMFGALGLVLLLACVNLANLQLTRLEARRKEIAVRAALGADRWRLARQLLTESLLLALVAGGMGMILAPAGVRLLLSFIPPERIPWLSVTTDRTVLLVSAGITLFVALLSGALPALRAARVDLVIGLAGGGTAPGATGASRRMRRAFLIAQLALSLAPLAGAGLLIQSFVRLQRVDPGFAADQRLTLSYSAPRIKYREREKLAALAEAVREEVSQLPGVQAAGLAQALPFAAGIGWLQAITRQDPKSIENPANLPHVRYNVVSAGYVEALGVPLKAGRAFTRADTRETTPVVIINESLARKHFAGEDPLGKQFWVGHAQALSSHQPRTVVGVIGDALLNKLEEPAEAAAWVPLSQQESGEDVWRTLFLVVHTKTDPLSLMAGIRQRIAKVDPDLALTDIRTMEVRLDESVWRQRLAATAMGALSLAALIIASLGVFGIIGYLVSRRTHEIGVRMALGATGRDIIRLVMSEGCWLTLAGVSLGLFGSLMLTRFLSSLLYGVSATDPITFVIAALSLAGAALLACYLPARRAAKVDPLIAIRHE